MASAKLTKSIITNALNAIVAAGLNPCSLNVQSDGSFRVEIIPDADASPKKVISESESKRPEKFEEVSCN